MTAAQIQVLLAFLGIALLFLLANYGERQPVARTVSLVVMATLAGSLTVLSAIVAFVLGPINLALGRITLADLRSAQTFSGAIGISGILSLAYLAPVVQRAVARWLPLRPGSPVHYTAVVLGLLLLGAQLGMQLGEDVLATLSKAPPISEADLLVQEIPLVVLAFVGVGLFTRRSWLESVKRLGLLLPRPAWWWLVALLAIAVFYGIGFGIDRVADVLTPGTQKRLTDVTNVLFRRFENPGAVILLGTAAGIGEETLFRGALLPRFGVVLTALVFAGVHTQYGLTFATLEVFILGVLLGWLRLRAGTLACIVTHAGYDITVGLLSLR